VRCCEVFPGRKDGYYCRRGVLSLLEIMIKELLAVVTGIELVTWIQLNKSYMEICKSTIIPPVGILEFLSMCRVVADQVQTEKCVSSFSSFLSILFT
jgi:hypothetical protein